VVTVHPPPGSGPYGVQVTREAIRRSWVLVSALDERAVEEARTWGADVVVLDLEESVHDSRKAEARTRIGGAIEAVARGGAEVFVRPDIDLLYADLDAAIVPGLTGVVLPMVSSAEQVREADRIVDGFERQRGLPGVVELHLALETAEGNLRAPEIIAASARVRSVSLGRADLVMDLRPEPNGELHMMPYLLQRLVTVARAGGVEPVGAWWDAESRGMVASPEATLRAARRARRHGFRGGMGVRASQVDPLNAGFTPDVAEVARAEVLVHAFETARARGERWGVEQGQIVDAARAETARRVIAHAELCRGRDQRKQAAAAAATHK
jgi:citrate lyase subunit beta / citryl-CoA lyase